MSTSYEPEPLDETAYGSAETRGGDHLADIVLPPDAGAMIDAFLDDPSTGVTRERPA